MDKDSIIELQKIDSNCNDCIFMKRDINKYKESLEKHKTWQERIFNNSRDRVIEKAKWWKKRGDIDKSNGLFQEAKKMRFQFNKSNASINFGWCEKLEKDVSFIPNHCQLDTQKCFKHRRDI